ncbi:YceI family protein [Sphingobium nicotianae]|uniref:YceI family protein n=1 Tax=Sphingobium nicotianae TaxID=2782607 RepID=A0A9X1AI67_9SPHN|nr:YceI family protein [Sphingobium nicotianae]MBT2185711.1 YceI family protein [Sphingobium nicotianae]
MRLIHAALPALLVTGLAGALIAQPGGGAPGKPDPSVVTAGSYTVDPGHTLVKWQVDHLGFTPYFGLFGSVTGSLTLDPKNLSAAKVDVTIPVSKVTTASSGLTAHLLKPAAEGKPADFFGAAPADAKFVSTKVTANGTSATIDGNLTLNGVTKPVTLQAKFYGAGKMPAMMGGKEGLGFTATGSIKRSDFGVGYGIPMVSDQVDLEIVAGFNKN